MWFSAWYGVPPGTTGQVSNWKSVLSIVHDNYAIEIGRSVFGNIAPSSPKRYFIGLYFNTSGQQIVYQGKKAIIHYYNGRIEVTL